MKKNLDMTEGKPISLLWAFTFPTLMGNLLNQVYSITDSIVVGRYLGQTALAAVGSTMPVILLLAALGGGGAFAYIKFIKPKQGAKVSADPDDYEFEDEEYENEDVPEQGEQEDQN